MFQSLKQMLYSNIIITCSLILFLLLILFIAYIEPHIKFSNKVPTVPFWVTLLPLFNKDIDQRDLWFKYILPKIEKFGIVKIFFAGRWNLLVADPEYMNQLFKYEYKIYKKSGNNEKISNSLLAHYTGTNIISAHGSQWKKFRNILLPGFLNFNDYSIVFKNSKLFCKLILSFLENNTKHCTENEILTTAKNAFSTGNLINKNSEKSFLVSDKKVAIEKGSYDHNKINIKKVSCSSSTKSKKNGSILISTLVQKLCLANISEIALGLDIGTLSDDHSFLYESLITVKKEIFKPLFMTFPFLDNWVMSRKATKHNIDDFKNALFLQIQKSLITNYRYEQETYLNPAANLIKNNVSGVISNKELLDNLTIILVAGHENPQLLLTSVIYMLAKHTWVQDDIRKELFSLERNSDKDDNNLLLLGKSIMLNSVIYETIRLYPPIGQLINRKTSKDCFMTSSKHQPIFIKEGTYIGYNNFGLQRQVNVWGKDSNKFKPTRWGSTIEEINQQWKIKKSKAEIGAFHGGNRNCIGEEIALNIMRITIFEMIKQFEWKLADDWKEKFTSSGPICPVGLKITLTSLI